MIVNERYLQEHNVSPPPREPFVPKLACSHVKDMKIDGVWFEAGKCTDPGCPVHGLEAKVKAMARPIVITPNDADDKLPVQMAHKGLRRAPRKKEEV